MFGFHGTSKEKADLVLKDGFKISKTKNVPNDLGTGIYFYIDSEFGEPPEIMARNFCCIFRKVPKTKVNIIKSEINESAMLLDFDIKSNLVELSKFRNENLDNVKSILKSLENGNGLKKRGNLDGIAIELYVNYLNEKYATQIAGVKRSTFTRNEEVIKYKASNIPNGKELCIYETSYILSNVLYS